MEMIISSKNQFRAENQQGRLDSFNVSKTLRDYMPDPARERYSPNSMAT